MPVVLYIILFAIIGSLLSLAGGLALLVREDIARRWSGTLAALAAGTLIGTAFLDLLPEAIERGGAVHALRGALIGFLIFFIAEQVIVLFHARSAMPHHEDHGAPATTTLVVAGDTMHNFIDGIVIAGTFMASVPLGVMTSIAVAMHEIPQEIGDFGVLLHNGMSRRRVLLVNLFSALATIAGGLLAYAAGSRITPYLHDFLGAAAGFFVYIAAADLIPQMQHAALHHRGRAVLDVVFLLIGAGVPILLPHG